ncbi:MAG: serine/threonine protein phosphatase [Lachnospiraceae bacterium]|nr:serine/threonine protein phosphatase [Lachnospiraceae bacterium]
MIYVMSDIHGCYDKYEKMLKKINLTNEDTIYILGDVLDKGPAGMKVLLDIADRDNIILLRGNHEYAALIFLWKHHVHEELEITEYLPLSFELWWSDGGSATATEFSQLDDKEQEKALDVIKRSLISKELEINGQKYLLAHTAPEIEKVVDYDNWMLYDFIIGEPDYDEVYFRDKIIVTGHTPTGYIDNTYKGRIWKGNNHIAIDCGAAYGGSLGCICLDTMEEFYV